MTGLVRIKEADDELEKEINMARLGRVPKGRGFCPGGVGVPHQAKSSCNLPCAFGISKETLSCRPLVSL